ncbi:MAG: hypothetical protein ACR2NN_11520 [Bryobacteraceae bacterium]
MHKSYTRTTVDIPNTTYEKLRKRAADQDCSMNEVILQGVETILTGPRKKSHRVKLPIIRSKRPGSVDLDNEKIYQAIPFP